MKIVSSKSLGYMSTYSPEMASPQHNYITSNSRVVHKNSHACAYAGVVSYRCLWFKAHFFPEWISAVLSNCDPKKAPRYISIARNEGWKPTDITRLGRSPEKAYEKFDIIPVDINNLSSDFSVIGNVVSVGLLTIKGIGEADRVTAERKDKYESLDDFVIKTSAGKTLIERLIRLGAFEKLPGHENRRALWHYYSYTYKKFSSTERKAMLPKLLEAKGWTPEKVLEERARQVAVYQEMYPKRNPKGFPKKITAWVPEDKHDISTFNDIFKEYHIADILAYELEYLGYNLSNPMLLYDTKADMDIDGCINDCYANRIGLLECIIMEAHRGETAKGDHYCRLNVTDGRKTTTVFIWSNNLGNIDPALLRSGMAVMIQVQYQSKRQSFTMLKDSTIIQLNRKNDD